MVAMTAMRTIRPQCTRGPAHASTSLVERLLLLKVKVARDHISLVVVQEGLVAMAHLITEGVLGHTHREEAAVVIEMEGDEVAEHHH